MPASFPPGPYKSVQIGDHAEAAPWYVIPFDKTGACTAPLTRQHLVNATASKSYTDIFLFSHGWNNDWDDASARYEDFIGGFVKMRADFGLTVPRVYHPLLAGIFWPSTALVMPWERAPKFAAVPAGVDDSTDAWRRELEDLAGYVDDADRTSFYDLAQAENLTSANAERLATILAKAATHFGQADTEFPGSGDVLSPTALLARATRIPGTPDKTIKPGTFGFASPTARGPQAAFSLADLDPRKLVRVATVLQMKDRAGRVGAYGVGPLLREMLAAHPAVRVHLIGHSYGAIVMLSAVCYPPEKSLPAPVDSILLLQPAVSQWCFAANVAGEGFPGGYRPALDRVRGPIFTTFTRRDSPLTKLFHLAVRRDKDLGQPQIAAGGLPQAPSPYAALGGFGPAGLSDAELQVFPIQAPATRYALKAPPPKVCALNGDTSITGHGDVSIPATWWALFQQLDALGQAGEARSLHD
jgi:hypothetical protein